MLKSWLILVFIPLKLKGEQNLIIIVPVLLKYIARQLTMPWQVGHLI